MMGFLKEDSKYQEALLPGMTAASALSFLKPFNLARLIKPKNNYQPPATLILSGQTMHHTR